MKSPLTIASWTLAALCLAGALAQADPITVQNYSFENPNAGTGVTFPNNWNAVGGSGGSSLGAYNPYEAGGGNAFYIGANSGSDPANGGSGITGIDGSQVAYSFNNPANSGFSQTLTGTTLTAATAYTLQVSVGARNSANGSAIPLTFAGSTIELLAGNTVIASATDMIGPTGGGFENQVAFLPNSDSLNPLLIGQTLSIELLTTNDSSGRTATDWDNVRLDATPGVVPEPASIISLLTAALGLGGLQVSRRHKAVDRIA